jgi:multiple sugar transport system permease protein
MVILGASMLFPFVWLVRSSFMNQLEIFATPMQWLPSQWLWSNYQQVFTTVPFASYFRNTAILEVLNILGTVASSSFVAFGFARIDFAGRRVLFALVISTLMLPSVVTLIPSFVIWHDIGGVNTYFPLFVPAFFGNALFIFMLRQFYMGLPRDYDEAAVIDGANYLGIYWSIILPLSRPALVAVALFTFLNVWNDFLTPLIYLSDSSMYTVALGLQVFQGQYTSQWNLVMAASTVAVIPVILAFFFGQKSFIQGATLTGLKG